MKPDEKKKFEETIYLKIFKKVLERGIEKELESPDSTIFGYRIIIHNAELEHFFSVHSKFIQLMENYEIILKTRIGADDSYFVLFILSELINKDHHFFMEHPIEENYYQYLEDIDDNTGYDQKAIWEKMLSEPADFWYQQNQVMEGEGEGIYHFYGNKLTQYQYRDGKYYQVYYSKDRKTGNTIERCMDMIEEVKIEKREDKIYQSLHKSSKFSHERKPLVEYTLQDMLDFVNQLLEVYDFIEMKEKIHPELLTEAKNPKFIQKYLDLGLSIEEALESVGYN